MNKNSNNKLLNLYKDQGYFLINQFFKKKEISLISNQLKNYHKMKCDSYFDRNGKIRRLEKFYNKTKDLKKLNSKILLLLKKIFGCSFIIFKDKYNFKPPNGEGFDAHYDGVYFFKINNKKNKGWYKYASSFVNVLIAFDNCTKKNGTLQLSKEHKLSFTQMYKLTKKNGTPNLKDSISKNLKFKSIILKKGDLCIFSNRCPHRSYKNKSKSNRKIFYYTYNKSIDGDNYAKYYVDKKKSKSKFKALAGEI